MEVVLGSSASFSNAAMLAPERPTVGKITQPDCKTQEVCEWFHQVTGIFILEDFRKF
jgi:hypothetical protein